MSTEIIKADNELIQKLVLDGDLSKMNNEQKVMYYKRFCESLGLNHLTQPFQLIKFQGRERLYATKDCTEQLRKIHGVSIIDISTNSLSGVFIVTAKAQDKHGKTDAATGAVPIEGLKGDALANALMKAETKAKRRVTLSICGLGILDESETDTMGKVEIAKVEDPEFSNVPTISERQSLINMVYSSTLTEEKKEETIEWIQTKCHTYKEYELMHNKLEMVQPSIDEISNPSAKDIKKAVSKIAG